MNIPPEALPWISVHRTHIDAEKPHEAYKASLAEDYRMILPFLPVHCHSVLDIGCGMAGIDLFLYIHYRKQVHLQLLDGTGDAEVKFGYNPELSPYNHLGITHKFLLMNQVDAKHIQFHPIDPQLTIPCDLIVSLLSWGFHYPASTYSELAKRSLRSGGMLVLDIRKGTDYGCLRDNFVFTKKIYEREGKVERLIFRAS
jgi:SAM-dependent methyltransferase